MPDSHHYSVDARYLGEDQHGTWLASPVGTRIIRPDGTEIAGWYDVVSLVPRDEWYLLHFWLEHPEVQVYVDIATPAVWDERGVKAVDLDLDVIQRNDGSVVVDDEDEFAEHQVTLGYPPDIVEGARRSADEVVSRLERGETPFCRGAAAPWIERSAGNSLKS